MRPFPGKVILFVPDSYGDRGGSLLNPSSRDLGELFRRYLPSWLGRGAWVIGRLEKIRWLHLTPTRLEWPERFFKRHGDKTGVCSPRFIPVIPSAWPPF